MKQAYDLKSTIDFSLNHAQRHLQEKPASNEQENTEQQPNVDKDRI
jgi:hypothetical protein